MEVKIMKKTFKKRAFISAIAMLIVSAIVLTSATYAWFSMAKKVEVESMELNVTSPEGIQISANTTSFTTKLTTANITGTDETSSGKRFNAYEGNTNHIPETIKPSSSTFAVSSSTGLPSWYDGSINENGTMDIYSTSDTAGGYVVFDLFVKLKSATTVKFGESTITCEGNDELPTAMRIALLNCGLVAEKADATVIQATHNLSSTANKVVYEVDATNHTSSAQAMIGTGTLSTLRPIAYAGTNITCEPYSNTVLACTGDLSATLAQTASAATIKLQAGVSRVRVYMWMEGNDIDCGNDVAGATINFNLILTID
jgi:hypothetical protein